MYSRETDISWLYREQTCFCKNTECTKKSWSLLYVNIGADCQIQFTTKQKKEQERRLGKWILHMQKQRDGLELSHCFITDGIVFLWGLLAITLRCQSLLKLMSEGVRLHFILKAFFGKSVLILKNMSRTVLS